jgi:hypothetical protein
MSGVYYLLTIFAIGVVIAWSIQNDQLPPGEETQGILRMKRPKQPAKAKQ